MLVQLSEIYPTGEPRYQVWLRDGEKVVLLRIFRHGTEALDYADEVSELLGCAVHYGYEHIVLKLCAKSELWERMES